eukprot:CAMPEP_0179124510 /NCGR_PEP_ID=MMETSP0796-20121207/58844_1 /TAXON_ID=73915 /ORGANISM="Pyrodinium bahamense, Strain pbaha01" /LENGTH=84 /DNA_ID=CAMNT_0020823177 /DNA_START=66 /DNA_END=317 /DNA_ORIENTATION=-
MVSKEAARRPILSAFLVGVALFCIVPKSCLVFVGTRVPACQRGGLLPARVSAEYLERCGPKDADVPFSSSAATGPTHDVEFKKR